MLGPAPTRGAIFSADLALDVTAATRLPIPEIHLRAVTISETVRTSELTAHVVPAVAGAAALAAGIPCCTGFSSVPGGCARFSTPRASGANAPVGTNLGTGVGLGHPC